MSSNISISRLQVPGALPTIDARTSATKIFISDRNLYVVFRHNFCFDYKKTTWISITMVAELLRDLFNGCNGVPFWEVTHSMNSLPLNEKSVSQWQENMNLDIY